MKKYQIPTLDQKTPQSDQSKIVNAVKAVSGVSDAILRPNSHEIEVTGKDQSEPKREEIASAVSRIGFPLAAK